MFVALRASLRHAPEVFATELDREPFSVVGIVTPARDGDLAERLSGAEVAAGQWHAAIVTSGAAYRFR